MNTLGVSHDRLDQSAALHIYHLFFEAIDLYVSKGVSLIAEAAFQHHLWEPQLLRLRDKADIRIVICEIGADLAKKRFADRLLVDPERGRLHGDHLVRESGGLQRDTYVSVKMDVPTLVIDTTDGYDPDVPGVIAFIGRASKKKG